MDEITRAHYELTFEVAFIKKKGNEFQAFFSSIMEKCYPGDFVRVKPWGAAGDEKCDGYLRARRILFQCYAPNEMKAAKCISKIDEDFNGALPHWKAYFDSWVFVHNSYDGIGPPILKKLLELSHKHTPLAISHWGYEELRQEVQQLAEPELASLFGPAPSRKQMIELGLEQLTPVLDHIALLPATPDPDLRPVPADKLHRNQLSSSVEILLRAGMSRADLVRKYFKLKPTLQDQIAESLRAKYQELKVTAATPDTIFADLQRFAGGAEVSSPSHQSAVLAVLAFFFEECDIFERPSMEGGT